ncbi:MAG: hypothetical protein JNL80_11080 [Phycisphaerae bacterium]|nr:hypothetical protein [Phycisphaerae bacterium]
MATTTLSGAIGVGPAAAGTHGLRPGLWPELGGLASPARAAATEVFVHAKLTRALSGHRLALQTPPLRASPSFGVVADAVPDLITNPVPELVPKSIPKPVAHRAAHLVPGHSLPCRALAPIEFAAPVVHFPRSSSGLAFPLGLALLLLGAVGLAVAGLRTGVWTGVWACNWSAGSQSIGPNEIGLHGATLLWSASIAHAAHPLASDVLESLRQRLPE